MNNKLTIRLDASASKESSCLLRTYNTVIAGYREPLLNNDILYGIAGHKFISTMYETGDMGLAMKEMCEAFDKPCFVKPKKQYMTKEHLRKLCFWLWENHLSKDTFEILAFEGKPMVEKKFALPYYSDNEIEVVICGTMDKIGKIKNGDYAVGDYKFTSVWEVQKYLSAYALSPQLMFYTFALKQYAKHYPDSLLGKIGATPVRAFIDGVFVKPDADKMTFERSEAFLFKDEQLAEFESLLQNKIQELKILALHKQANITYEIPRHGMFNGSCQTSYGNCKFFQACSAPDSISRESIYKKLFVQKPYDPLNFNE